MPLTQKLLYSLSSIHPQILRKRHLTQKQTRRLSELLKINLASVRAYLLKEDFQRFWAYKSVGWADKFLEEWAARTMRSRLAPMKKVAKMLRSHKELILNWFRAGGELSSGPVEGLNNKAKLAIRKAYGFKTTNGMLANSVVSSTWRS